MNDQDERWPEVGRRVTAAMTDRAMSQADLVRASGVSSFTVRKVMNGTPGNYRPDRLAKIATALGWTGDSIQSLLDGGGVTHVGEARADLGGLTASSTADTTDLNSRVARLSPEDQRTIKELIDRFEREG